MRKFIGIISTLAVLGVVAAALLNNGNYRSMLDTEATATCNNVACYTLSHGDIETLPSAEHREVVD